MMCVENIMDIVQYIFLLFAFSGNWGPHLIIVPTSVMLNWEMELNVGALDSKSSPTMVARRSANSRDK